MSVNCARPRPAQCIVRTTSIEDRTNDGALAARERLSKKAIRAQPLVVGDVVYVQDVKGHIGAYRLSSP